MEKGKEKRNIRSLLFRCCATSILVVILDSPQPGALPMGVSSPTWLGVDVVFRDEVEDRVA
jgi:hypothetical protein